MNNLTTFNKHSTYLGNLILKMRPQGDGAKITHRHGAAKVSLWS